MTAVERLHYYNGQRLDAADLGLEQHYHLAMRRLLNRGLFTPGVVDGLEVDQPDPADSTLRAANWSYRKRRWRTARSPSPPSRR